MNANQDEALTLCKSILDNGSHNADVSWKLASALYQDGQLVKAGEILANALRLHPGNSKLLKLQDIISSSTTEQEMLELAAQLNQRSYDQGALKMSCLTKSGLEGIAACKRRLELTDDDGDNIRARLTELNQQQQIEQQQNEQQIPKQAPISLATSPPEQVSPASQLPSDLGDKPFALEDTPESVINSANNQVLTDAGPDDAKLDTELLAAEERKIAYKNLVIQVQSTLNELGFPTGTPDGFPGNKTRNALSDFYTVLDAPASKSINELTLANLNLEKSKLTNAKQLVKQSEEALANNNTELAKTTLADAKASSQLLKVPEALERKLRESQPDNPADASKETPIISNTNFGEPASPNTPGTTPSSTTKLENTQSEQFVDLMNKIHTLRGKIRRVEEDQVRRLEQVRNIK